jgi:hypothetical protein
MSSRWRPRLADDDPIRVRFELSHVKSCARRLATIGEFNNEDWRIRIGDGSSMPHGKGRRS